MIVKAFHPAAAEGAASTETVDDDAVLENLHGHAQRLQAGGHGGNAIAFLDPKLLGAPQHRTPLSAGRCHEQRRKLVDSQGYLIRGDFYAVERCEPDLNIRDRLAAHLAFVRQGDIRAHPLEDVDHAGAGGIDTHVLQQPPEKRRPTRYLPALQYRRPTVWRRRTN